MTLQTWPSFLGEIEIQVNAADLESRFSPNMPLHVDSTIFKNRKNQLAVMNKDRELIAWLPEMISFWLKPLLRQKKIFCRLELSEQEKNRRNAFQDRYQLTLLLFIEEEGQSIVQHVASPGSGPEAMHEIVRDAYFKLSQHSDPATIRELGINLKRSLNRKSLPETWMLLALFPFKAKEQQKKFHSLILKPIQDTILGVQTGDPLRHKGFTVFPLLSGNNRAADYALLKHSLEIKTAVVEEVSDEGHVHELTLRNLGEKPLLVPEGEILEGAKQNRVINISIMVDARSVVRIPVSCVERGRWHRVKNDFEATHYAHPKLRSKKMESVFQNRKETGEARSDQGEVWEEVSEHLQCCAVFSETDSVTEAYEKSALKNEEYIQHFTMPEEAIGAAVASGNEITGLDLFDSPAVFSHYWERLSHAYFMEERRALHTNSLPKHSVKRLLETVAERIELCEKPIGIGHELMLHEGTINGVGVWHSDSLCHLSVFS